MRNYDSGVEVDCPFKAIVERCHAKINNVRKLFPLILFLVLVYLKENNQLKRVSKFGRRYAGVLEVNTKKHKVMLT